MRKWIITAVLAALAVAGCGTAAGTGSQPAASGHAAASSTADPFKITPLFCGQYTPAQVNQFADYSGLIFRYTNRGTETAAPELRVNFVNGSTVAGDNVNGAIPDIAPGQSAIGEVGAVGGMGATLHFKTCQPVSYTVDKDWSGQTYQP